MADFSAVRQHTGTRSPARHTGIPLPVQHTGARSPASLSDSLWCQPTNLFGTYILIEEVVFVNEKLLTDKGVCIK